ncbi:MAG: PspC domain-containing protein [Acidimicrobiia bacterium]|nr:PspC domain-containing protein [Acidimicrobiia bacterium]
MRCAPSETLMFGVRLRVFTCCGAGKLCGIIMVGQEYIVTEHITTDPVQRVDRVKRIGLPVRRTADDRVLTGLASGIARVLEIDPVFVRAAFVTGSLAGGVGIVAYLAGWVLTLDDPDPHAVALWRERLAVRGTRRRVALGMIFLGFLLLLKSFGLWFGDSLVWPMAMASFGFALTWSLIDQTRRSRWTQRAFPVGEATKGGSAARIVVGGVLMTAGLGLYLESINAVGLVGGVVLAVAVTVAGLVLVFGPWMWRLVNQLTDERRERIRLDERAEVAAHLHDSVLQTLALMQRTGDPRRMAMLARQQERELRNWLYGDGQLAAGETLRQALEALASRVEDIHQVPVDVVTAGDLPLNDSLRALVGAAGEAVTNAAKHSGGTLVSVFAEVEGPSVDVYVSDQGVGFDPHSVPDDRRGISESIIGRMQRQGGSATVNSEPGEGTEVHLSVRQP